jgi:hypothetical protein
VPPQRDSCGRDKVVASGVEPHPDMIARASWSKFDRRVAGYKRERPAWLWAPSGLFRCVRKRAVSCVLTWRGAVDRGSTTRGGWVPTRRSPGPRSWPSAVRRARSRVGRAGVSPVTRWAKRFQSRLDTRALRLRWVRRRSGSCPLKVMDDIGETRGKGGLVTTTIPHPRLEPIVEGADDGDCTSCRNQESQAC